ncbi:Rrf2 family transcriptional regulator [Staphylococcus muscae]|uniref:Rrf2 family transcriptional regulator n=1 Tax=Staphylococcus muscae TaxID=1294 RepID=A0A240C7N5_9STAP|nr:Rrf2 family transcriptional regulator [Staphylococcus muscae]AVQ33410.1 Rrf2 family transcriptional regulator [Staphylococcus muscae]PNZ04310.1 Rrf2 family transcriptional regulator [Staphylococcus muscae]GGA89935.1 Rrf2 family transcriptional regulator [Staphylococcus muscae]SNW03196.1 Rrf2 family transcriptional regulator [Staphylococcus muscae]
MRPSTKLSSAVHILSLIAMNPFSNLTSERIAESMVTNPSAVRQIMSQLKKANLINSVHGHAQPVLNKPPESINLLEIYRAVEGDKPLLHLKAVINPDCGPGTKIQSSLGQQFDILHEKIFQEFASVTLKDILDGTKNMY